LVLIVSVPNPPNFSAINPFTLLRNTVLADIGSDTVLLARLPLAYVFSAVCPDESSLAFSLIIQKLTLVLLAVSPGENALAVHFVFRPVSRVRFPVRPIVVAIT
jgi:hypothetical protein